MVPFIECSCHLSQTLQTLSRMLSLACELLTRAGVELLRRKIWHKPRAVSGEDIEVNIESVALQAVCMKFGIWS